MVSHLHSLVFKLLVERNTSNFILNGSIVYIVFAKIRYLCKCVTRNSFLPSELQDNAHFYPYYIMPRFDLNEG